MAQRKKPGVAKAHNTQLARLAQNEKPKFYVCCTCGKHYETLDRNFPSSQSELWAGNEYHLPVCRVCVDRMYDHYLYVYGDERKALRRICMIFDMYYSDALADSSGNITKNRSRVMSYIQKHNITQYAQKTYDTTLDEENRILEQRETLLREEEAAAKGEPPKITKAVIARWGAGAFSYEEYATLEEHYNMLKKNNPNIDSNQEIFVKDLCMIHMMKMNAAKEKDVDTYNRTSEQYSRIFSKAGLKTIEEKDTSMNDSLGVTLSVISQYTPEEFYKDKQLYSDYDELGEYYDRHIRRPMQNLMTQTDVRDPEFNISDEDDNEETEG